MNVISILSRTLDDNGSELTLAEGMILYRFLQNRLAYHRSAMIIEKIRLKYLNAINKGESIEELAKILESLENAKKIKKQSKAYATKFNLAWKKYQNKKKISESKPKKKRKSKD